MYSTVQLPSLLSLHDILASEGPSMARPSPPVPAPLGDTGPIRDTVEVASPWRWDRWRCHFHGEQMKVPPPQQGDGNATSVVGGWRWHLHGKGMETAPLWYGDGGVTMLVAGNQRWHLDVWGWRCHVSVARDRRCHTYGRGTQMPPWWKEDRVGTANGRGWRRHLHGM